MQVSTELLDMCTTSGRNCGTAVSIFTKIDSILAKHNIPWSDCVGFGVDNTSVNVGIRNSIMTHVKQKFPPVISWDVPNYAAEEALWI